MSLSLENYYLPIVMIISATAGMYYCRKQLQTTTVLADERDYQVAGRASRYALIAYAWLGAIGTFVLMAISKGEGALYDLSQYLSFSVLFLLLLNAVLFKILRRKS
jgi:uncharacterized membrane protein